MNSKLPSGRHLREDILRAVDRLPAMPQIVHRALGMANDPNSSFKILSDLIESDQALAMEVLRLSNSAYYSRMGKVSSVQEGAIVLGLKALAELIILVCTSKVLGISLQGYDLASESLWRHSLGVAVGSRIIANKKYPALTDEAFTAGLIHDVGKLILDDYVVERKEKFLEFLSDGEDSFLNAEKEILGFDHAEIAAIVCEKWGFAKPISVAIKYHHHPSRLRGNTLAFIVHVADQVAIWSGMDIDGITLELGDNSGRILGIDDDDIEELMDEVVKSVNQITGRTT